MREQVFYNGRWHDPNQFRAWVYHPNGEKKLCNHWVEFDVMLQNGWSDQKPAPNTLSEKDETKTPSKKVKKAKKSNSDKD